MRMGLGSKPGNEGFFRFGFLMAACISQIVRFPHLRFREIEQDARLEAEDEPEKGKEEKGRCFARP